MKSANRSRTSFVRVPLAPLLATALTLACTSGDGIDRSEGADGLRGLELPDPIEVQGFSLIDTSEGVFDFLEETRGHVTFLFFGYTNCPDICPVQLATIAAALGDLAYEDRQKTRVVFITTDPDRDSPRVVREYLDRFDHDFIGLGGDLDFVNDIQEMLMLPRSVKQRLEGDGKDEYLVGHAAQILVIDGSGRVRAAYPAGVRQTDWKHDLPRLLEYADS